MPDKALSAEDVPAARRKRFGDGVPAAAAALTGALFVGLTAAGVLPWYASTALLLASAALFRRPWTVLCILVFLFGFGAFRLRAALEPRPELGTRDLRSHAVLVVDDARISSVPGVNGGVRSVRAKLRSFTDPATGRERPGRDAAVMLVLPEECLLPRCGTVIEASGVVSPLAFADEGDEFIARLKRRGFCAVVRADDWRCSGRETGVRTLLADGRDAMLVRLFDGVHGAEVKKLAAALYCGVVSGLPGEVREDFAAAGIVHIFSVSGIHVAVLALCFAWLLRFLSFRVRYPALTILVWLYVLATGAGTPAVRAGVMVTLWALLRVLLLRLRGIDVLCWTAVLVLLIDPMLVADPGAQYSFLITGALLLLAERRDSRRFPRRAEPEFVPRLFSPRYRRAAKWCAENAKTIGIGAGTAFLAGAAVALRTGQRRLGTGAVAANVLIALLMPIFFALFFIQLAAGACGLGRFTAGGFEWAFLRLRDFAAFFAENFPDAGVVPPHWSVTLVYLLALLVLLRSRRKLTRGVAGTVLAAIALWQLARPYTLPPAVLVHAAEYGRPPLVAAADPARRRAVVVNAPDPGSARRAAEFLRARGIREVEVLTLSARDGVAKKGLAALEREAKIRRFRFGANIAKPPAVGGAAAENAEKYGDLCRIVPLEGGFRLEYFDHGSKLCFGVTVTEGDAGCEVVVERPGKRAAHTLPWSIDREEWVYEFTE